MNITYRIALLLFFIFFYACKSNVSTHDNLDVSQDVFYIPFEIKNGRIIVTVKLNNKVNIRLSVDNGCHNLALTEGFVKDHGNELGVLLHPNLNCMGYFAGDPSQKTYIAEGDFSYHFGDSIFANKNTAAYFSNKKMITGFAEILEPGSISSDLNKDSINGILPLEILSKNGLLEIDFQNKRIKFPKNKNKGVVEYSYTLKNSSQHIQLPIQIYQDTLVFQTVLNAMFDLGYRGDLLVFQTKETKILESYTSKNSVSHFMAHSYYFSYFDALKIGKNESVLRNVFTGFIPYSNINLDVIIGFRILSKFNLLFDYQKQSISLKSLENEIYLSDTLSFLKASLSKKNTQYYISSIFDTCHNLFKLGDTIVAINGVALSTLKVDSISSLLEKCKIGFSYATVQRGSEQITICRNNQLYRKSKMFILK